MLNFRKAKWEIFISDWIQVLIHQVKLKLFGKEISNKKKKTILKVVEFKITSTMISFQDSTDKKYDIYHAMIHK